MLPGHSCFPFIPLLCGDAVQVQIVLAELPLDNNGSGVNARWLSIVMDHTNQARPTADFYVVLKTKLILQDWSAFVQKRHAPTSENQPRWRVALGYRLKVTDERDFQECHAILFFDQACDYASFSFYFWFVEQHFL